LDTGTCVAFLPWDFYDHPHPKVLNLLFSDWELDHWLPWFWVHWTWTVSCVIHRINQNLSLSRCHLFIYHLLFIFLWRILTTMMT
jgi:hypothetical protein